MLYWIVTAMYPQFLITLNEQLEEQPVTVRVGQAVNTVGLAGQRMGISGVCLLLVCSGSRTHTLALVVPNTSNASARGRGRASGIRNQRMVPVRPVGGYRKSGA
jgi:hypothetical protein